MSMPKVVPVTRGGQISIPAEIRRRWKARKVIIEDEGDRLVVRPQPVNREDLIQSLIGRFKLPEGMTVEQITEQWREEEIEAEERKWREYHGERPAG